MAEDSYLNVKQMNRAVTKIKELIRSSAGTSSIWKPSKTAGEFYKADDAPTATNVGKFDGYLYATRVYNAVYNDYAELFFCKEPIPVNHLAYITEEGCAKMGNPKLVIGIVSDCYGHLLGGNGNPDDPSYVPISLAGRVPLEIKGEVELGDLVAARSDGLGEKANDNTPRGQIVGKVVGKDPRNRKNYYEILVGGF